MKIVVSYLRYLCEGGQNNRGRKMRYYGKIEVSWVDKRRIPLVHSNKEQDIYAGVVYTVVLKWEVLAAFVYDKDKNTGAYKTNRKGRASVRLSSPPTPR